MGAIRNFVTASAVAVSLTVGAAATATAAPAPTVAHVQSAPLAGGPGSGMLAPQVNVDFSWFPTAWYITFNETETSGIVQAGVGGAAAYAATMVPQPILKALITTAGVALWATAKNAIETADRRCLVVMIWALGIDYYPTEC
jgi:hypothetical protein